MIETHPLWILDSDSVVAKHVVNRSLCGIRQISQGTKWIYTGKNSRVEDKWIGTCKN